MKYLLEEARQLREDAGRTVTYLGTRNDLLGNTLFLFSDNTKRKIYQLKDNQVTSVKLIIHAVYKLVDNTIKSLKEAQLLGEGYENVIINYLDSLGITQDSYWRNGVLYVTASDVDEVRYALDNFENISTLPRIVAIEEARQLSENTYGDFDVGRAYSRILEKLSNLEKSGYPAEQMISEAIQVVKAEFDELQKRRR